MAHDELLTMKFRDALPAGGNYTEKKMMGGVCFMLNGNMIGGADRTRTGQGRLMFRVGKDNVERAEKLPGAEPMIMGGKRMSGFFFVDEAVADKKVLKRWIKLALEFVGQLPAK